MTKILVVGCSMTAGAGLCATVTDPFKIDVTDPNLWVNQLCHQLFDTPQVTNLAITGKNNEWIFNETACALVKDHYDVVLVAWSELGRFNYNIGLESYSTATILSSLGSRDIKINPGVTVSAKWQSKIGDQLRKFLNDHWTILDLIKYVNIRRYKSQLGNLNYFLSTHYLTSQWATLITCHLRSHLLCPNTHKIYCK
jgi:hypothetical protein